MFQKLHLYLTAMCAGITAAIMIVMSLCYLYISEKGLYDNQYASFQNDINTIATSLEQQSVISMEWLAKMESRGNYSFFVLDNGIPFLYNRLGGFSERSATKALLDQCLNTYKSSFEYEMTNTAKDSSFGLYNTSLHTEFPFNPTGAKHEFYASVIELNRNDSSLQMVVLCALDFLEEQIHRQRIRFVVIDIAAVLILTLFSFFFTGRLLQPIIENRRNQTAFIAAASHELRTPLSVILSAADCCRNADAPEREGFLDTIRQEGTLMSSLINDMLTLSNSDNHNFPIRPRDVELDTLLMNTYEAFEPLARKHSLTLRVTLPDDTVPVCTADDERISQVLSILVHNAISYTPAGGEIELSLLYKKNRFHLIVSDTGIGIADEDKKRIFDRFYRAEKSRSTKGHFGLGLSIASEIVRLHHGTITVSDRPGGGSIFTVTLP